MTLSRFTAGSRVAALTDGNESYLEVRITSGSVYKTASFYGKQASFSITVLK